MSEYNDNDNENDDYIVLKAGRWNIKSLFLPFSLTFTII